ncbi:MAG: YedE family putative selenium transporter [Syntrophobacterales bacterium]|nr:YedE family putative selenium transporter [Syntrophobacterales bacterium]
MRDEKSIMESLCNCLGYYRYGAVIGILATIFQKLGNPPNMGICVACMERDIAGALGLHRVATVQYLRPEIIGFVLGSFIAALTFGEFRPRAGSAPIVRFFLGFLRWLVPLSFLGCPWRALLRIAGGDGNAIFGLLGLFFGVWIGTLFFKRGYSLGRATPTPLPTGLVMVLIVMALLFLRIIYPPIQGQPQSGVLFYSLEGPGSKYAPFFISLGVAIALGFIAQRSRFCTMGALRDLILFRNFHLFLGVLSLAIFAFISNLILGQFKPGFANQPIAHSMSLWNFLGMTLAGLSFALAGGCPGRQLFLAGEGDGDAAIFVLGIIIGAAFAHNFGFASTPKGIGPNAIEVLIVGLVFCIWVGFSMRHKEV